MTKDGRPLTDTIPNSFLDDFCDICDRWDIKGKFSIVPAPAGRGDVVRGIAGFPLEETTAWMDTVKSRVAPRFDFTPEGITHNLTVDLATAVAQARSPKGPGDVLATSSLRMLPLGESEWSQTQTRATLSPYLIRSLELLRDAGIDANGFTSPWVFGLDSEPEYIAAMVAAQRAVYGRDSSWYFLHMRWPDSRYGEAALHPWVAHQDDQGRLVSIPANVRDRWWVTIDDAAADPEAIARDLYDDCVRIADQNGWCMVLTHWQSLWSNGNASPTLGLQALEAFAKRIHDDGRFEWHTCAELAARTAP